MKIRNYFSFTCIERFKNMPDQQIQKIVEETILKNRANNVGLALDLADLVRVGIFLIKSDINEEAS